MNILNLGVVLMFSYRYIIVERRSSTSLAIVTPSCNYVYTPLMEISHVVVEASVLLSEVYVCYVCRAALNPFAQGLRELSKSNRWSNVRRKQTVASDT